MNEKLIAELWESATGSVMPKYGKFSAGESKENIITFVKLIVKECIVSAKEDSAFQKHIQIEKRFCYNGERFDVCEPKRDYWNNHYGV